VTGRALTAAATVSGDPVRDLSGPVEVVLDGATLTPESVARVAHGGVRVSLEAAARERNRRTWESIGELLEQEKPVYGASSGVGALRDHPVSAAERTALQWNLLRSHAVDAGPPLPAEVVRAAMTVRANQLGAGGAGVSPALLDRLVEALERGETPVVRALGSLGTGDLPGLARIALELLGRTGDGAPSDSALALDRRDALGFMSSNAVTAGRACLLWRELEALADLWLDVAALSFEAVEADSVVLAARVHSAGAAGQIAVAARMRTALGLSDEAERHTARRTIQDPYPFRVVPQVDGVTRDAAQGLRRALEREINARPENALIDDGRAWPNGNFHAAALAAALDALRGALAASAGLLAARVSALLDPVLSGLPVFLAGLPGRDSGMMMLEYTAHAAAAEVRSLAAPVIGSALPVSMGVESHASFAPVSAARLAEQLPILRVLVATELVVALRAFELAGRRPHGPHTARLHARAAAAIGAGLDDRDFGADVQGAVELVQELLELI
jgi:histidine ammonia-lyase